jgi:hypothetical protein
MEQQERYRRDGISIIDMLIERHELVQAMGARCQRRPGAGGSERADGYRTERQK